MISQIAVASIHGYRKWVSPRKGFRCAHHVVYGCGSCSDYGLEVFNNRPFFEAFGLLKQRFKECKMAMTIYQSQTQQQRDEARRQRQNNGNSNSCNDCAPGPMDFCIGFELGSMLGDCGGGASACDAGACDVGSCG